MPRSACHQSEPCAQRTGLGARRESYSFSVHTAITKDWLQTMPDRFYINQGNTMPEDTQHTISSAQSEKGSHPHSSSSITLPEEVTRLYQALCSHWKNMGYKFTKSFLPCTFSQFFFFMFFPFCYIIDLPFKSVSPSNLVSIYTYCESLRFSRNT